MDVTCRKDADGIPDAGDIVFKVRLCEKRDLRGSIHRAFAFFAVRSSAENGFFDIGGGGRSSFSDAEER